MVGFIKKNIGNLLFVFLLALMLIPQTRTPIQVFVQRLISFNPTQISEEKRETLTNYSWSFNVLNGATTNLDKSKEKVVIINLWATWCPPCIAEMPSLQSLYSTYKDQVDFYFVSQDSPEKLQKFIKANGYTFPVVIPTTKAPLLLQSASLPTTFVIAKDGSIHINKVGAANWDGSKMDALLTSLLKE